jgi:hypothetical protein
MTTKGNTLKKAAMLEALRHTLGNITEAISKVGISRKTHYLLLQTDEAHREDVDAITEAAVDFVESKLFQLIDGPVRTIETADGIKTVKDSPNAAAIIFFLKCKAKQRGYIERPANEPEVQVNVLHSKSVFDLGGGIRFEI